MKVSEFVKVPLAILLRENYGAVFARIHPFRYVGDPAVVSLRVHTYSRALSHEHFYCDGLSLCLSS